MGGLGDGLGREAPLDVLMGHQVAVMVDQRRVGSHGLPGIADRRQDLVLHLDELFGLVQDLLGLGGHDADGVAQVVGDAAHGDHGVPVLFQVSHLVLAGDVGGGEDAHHARQGLGLLGVDGQHPGPGMGRPDRRGVDHAVQIDVVGVLAVAQDLFPDVQPVDPLAQGPIRVQGRDLSLALELGGQQHGLDNLHIAGTAADIILDGGGAFGLGGVVVNIQQSLGAHHHARDTEAALHRPRRAVGIGIKLLFKLGKPLHGEDMLALQLVGLLDAGPDGLAVQQNGAGTAGALAAAVLDRGEMQLVPEKADQLLVLLHRDGCSVDEKCSHGDSSSVVPARPGPILLYSCIVPSFLR